MMTVSKFSGLDLNNYVKQGNLAIDMVVACIHHYRKQGVEPKAIVMNPKYYGILQQWVVEKYGEDHVLDMFYLDTVEIRSERIFSGKILHVEMWQTPKAEA